MRALTGRRAGLAAFGAAALAAVTLTLVNGAGAAPSGPRFGESYGLFATETPARGRDVAGLAVNPANPNHIVEADANPINLQCDHRVSFDGGRTWSGGHLTIRNSGENPAFPSPACTQNFDSGGYAHFNTGVVFGTGQNVYVTFSAHRGPFNRPESNVDGGDGDDAVVARSTDGGRTFAPAVIAVPGGGPVSANPGLAGRGMRPQIAVQPGAGTGGQDRLYVAGWHCHIKVRASQTARGGCSGGGGERRVLVARSDNGGATWTTPVLASAGNVRAAGSAAEAASTDEQAREPSQPVIGPDGAVYVAYRNRDITDGTTCPVNPALPATTAGFPSNKAHCIVVARSTDQGQNWTQFSTNVPVASGTLSNPRLAIDPTTPAGVGTLHVVYQRPVTPDPSDISSQSSTDRGQTWSAAVKVNDDPAGAVQTNPNVSVRPGGGRVDVIWGDRRHNYPGGGAVGDTYFASSTNGGATFPTNRRVNDRSFNLDVGLANELGANLTTGFSWFGPVSLPLPDGSALAAWTDSRFGNFDSGIQDIFLSRLNPSAPLTQGTIAAATRPGLSVLLSRLAYPGGTEAVGDRGGEPASRVVVANEDDVPAALAGAVLARARWGPLLLSPAAGLPAHVRAEAARMRPVGAYAVGDTSALSATVSTELRGVTRDGENVDRLAAPTSVPAANRPAETARRIAHEMAPLPGATPEAVIVNPNTATGDAGPQGVAAAALAAALRLPVLYVDSRTTLPPPTSSAITELGIKKALIVGNTASVATGVQNALNTLLGAANVTRLGGATPYEVSESVLAESRTRGLPQNSVYVGDAARPTDAAALGAAVGRVGGLMLLTPNASTATADTRLTALGFDGLADRVVGAIGTGGTDPSVAGPDAPGTPGEGGGAGTGLAAIGVPVPGPAAVPAVAGCPGARAARNPMVFTNGNDVRTGTILGDLIAAGSGDDLVDGLAGGDCIDLGPGRDRGQGAAGDDYVQGGTGNDTVKGAAGKDLLRGHRGNDRAEGGSGNDSILGGRGTDVLIGGSGNDRIGGDAGRDRISGGTGSDTISARDGERDRITCGNGSDRVSADEIDVILGGCERVRRE